jgi:acyl-CoA thioesterase
MKPDTSHILKAMLDHDNFSHWLGIVVDEYKEGYCRLHFTITDDMLNGFGIVHGGVVFSAADSAFAFACNSHGRISVALDVHISFIASGKTGDILTVEATEIHTGNRTSFYNVKVTNGEKIVAAFKGTAFRTDKDVVEEAAKRGQ